MSDEFSGPPEPIWWENDDGETELRVAHVTTDTTRPNNPTKVETQKLGVWMCKQCDQITEMPFQDGELSDPYCQNCERGGPFTHVSISDEVAKNAIQAPELWKLPTGFADTVGRIGIWEKVREYIYDHWDAQEEEIYEGLTAYALSTWFRPNLTFVPHLMLMGKTTGGKTRLLRTLARVSYRAVVSASATPASMYRMIDAYDVTFFVSEYHGLGPDARRELDNVVRAGQKRGEIVSRASGDDHDPEIFDPFSHIAIATQYTPDDDIVNRCIQVRSSPDRRDMPATFDEEQAEYIRNRLLETRFRLLDSEEWQQAENQAYKELAQRDIDGRTREKLLSLVTVAILWDKLDTFETFIEMVVEQDQEAAADSEDAQFVEVVRDLAFEESVNVTTIDDEKDKFAAIEIPYDKIKGRYKTMTGIEKSESWVGHVRSRLDLNKERKRDGTVIRDDELRSKLKRLCRENNLDWEASDIHSSVRELDEDNQIRTECEECGQLAKLTHRHSIDDYRMCQNCADDWQEAEA